MERKIASFPHSLVVKGERVDFQVELHPGEGADSFSVDLYDHGPHMHPERHLGYWTYPLTGVSSGRVELELTLDLYGGFPERVIRLAGVEGEAEPQATWSNPDFIIPPIIDMDLVVAGPAGEIERVYVGCYIHDREILKSYYSRDEHQEAYSDEQNIFLQVFHEARIRVLRRFFQRYFAGESRVVDVGSGYSMFRCMERDWPFEITCCDLDEPALRVIEEQSEGYSCVVSDAAELPFSGGEFDGLFAGEILEHVVEPEAALREWMRVVKPGGILVVTTPNAARLINRVNRAREVVNPEHISELSYKELWRLFEGEGLRVLECRGIYVEFLFNYFRKGRKIDLLPARFNRPRFRFVFRWAMFIGNLVRPVSYNLVYVLRKKQDPKHASR